MSRETTVSKRITVNLRSRAVSALEVAATTTGDSDTEVVNRALSWWAETVLAIENDGAVYIQPTPGAPLEKARLL